MITIQQLQNRYSFKTVTEMRSSETGRVKGGVYICIVQQKYIYVGITENTVTQRILEHLRHPKTRFTRLIHKLDESEVLWSLVETIPHDKRRPKNLYREDLGEAEKRWIRLVGGFNTEYGLNETSGGKGTTDVVRTQEWIERTREQKVNLYKDPEKRRQQRVASIEVHRLNPQIAKEHAKREKERYNGEGGKKARAKVSEGMRSFLENQANLAQHAWDRGGRPFVVVSNLGLQGAFLNNSECARQLHFSSSSHVSKCLKNPGKHHKGHLMIKTGLGMLYEEILELALEGDFSESNCLAAGFYNEDEQVEAWERGCRPFIVASSVQIIGIFLDSGYATRKTGLSINESALREGRCWIHEGLTGIPILNGITIESAIEKANHELRSIASVNCHTLPIQKTD